MAIVLKSCLGTLVPSSVLAKTIEPAFLKALRSLIASSRQSISGLISKCASANRVEVIAANPSKQSLW